MFKSGYDIVIAGGGMAGLACAASLSGHGLSILIIDENRHIGGQLLRKGPSKFHKKGLFKGFQVPDPAKVRGFKLIQALETASDVTWMPGAEICAVSHDRRLLVRDLDKDQCREIRAGQLIVATGARERYLPFKGWTLPGVMSLGAAQILMKSNGVLPARSVILGGSSPLMMAVADQVLASGGKINAMVDESGLKDKLKFLPLAPRNLSKLIQGGLYTARVAAAHVPGFARYRIIEARGKAQFDSAVIARTSRDGTVLAGTEKIIRAGALADGYGFVPNIELAAQAGCDIVYEKDLGGWVVKTGRGFETSCPHIFAVGETTGIGGAEKSLIEGQICGLSILDRMGKVARSCRAQVKETLADQAQHHRNQMAYAAFFNRLTRLPHGAYREIPDETVICRCEGITMGLLRQRAGQGFETMAGIKKASRAGMGRCQARICGPVIFDILTALTGNAPEKTGLSLCRPPVKNLPVQALLS